MDLRISEDITTCGICFEIFNDSFRCPRMLHCGHNFCHSCLEKLLIMSPCCPTCKTVFQFTKADSIPINFALKNLVSAIKDSSLGTNNNFPQEDIEFNLQKLNLKDDSSSGTVKFQSEGHCNEHDVYKGFRCMNHYTWICGMCGILYHKHCRTLLVEEAYKELKKLASLKVEKELKTRKVTEEKIIESLDVLGRKRIGLIEELKDCEKHIEELEILKSDGNIFCDTLKHILSLVENAENDMEFSPANIKLDTFITKEETIPDAFQHLLLPLTLEKLENWCQKEIVYAVKDRYSNALYGKLTVKQGQIWVSSFLPEKPEGRLLDFDKLVTSFPVSSELRKKVFFKLSSHMETNSSNEVDKNNCDKVITQDQEDGEDDVEIVVEVIGQTPRVQNFILLCSGLSGQSYKGLNLKSSPHFYGLNNSPSPVVEDIGSSDTRTPLKKGDLYGTSGEGSGFNISLEERPTFSRRKFGFVISGLENLDTRIVQNYLINDCGLVI